MSTSNEIPRSRRSRRRWRLWLIIILAVLAIPIVLFAALPWIASTPFAKRRIEAFANKLIAPGSVAFERARVSWFRPTEIDGPTLIDAQGDKIVSAPSGTFSWNLCQILFNQPLIGTLTLHHGAVDIERSADGRVDLLETLGPILKDKPERTIQIRIKDATLRFRQEGLADPFFADEADIALDLSRYPEPISWNLKLARTKEPSGLGTMNIEGHIGHDDVGDGPPRNAALAVNAVNWPWRFTRPEIRADGLFTGSLAAQIVDGALTTEGDAAALNLLVEGDMLSGDAPRQDRVAVGWKVEGRDGSFKVERFTLDAPVATLSAVGVFPPASDQEAKVEGRVDLAVLAGQLRHMLHLQDDLRLDKGVVEVLAVAKARSDEEIKTKGVGQLINVTAKIAELVATKGDRTITWDDPATLMARLDRSADSVALDQLDVKTPFLTASGKGDVDRGIDVAATFDLAAVRKRLRDWVDLGGVETAGQGTLNVRYRREQAEYQLAADAEVKGLVLDRLPVAKTVRRELVRGDLTVRGAADPSGIPRDWRFVSLLGKSGVDAVKLESTSEPGRQGPATVKAGARTELTFNGSKKVVKAGCDVRSNADAIDLGELFLSVEPFVGPGGTFLPESTQMWNGAGRYDRKKDELIVEVRPIATGEAVKSFAIVPQKLSAGGFQAKDAAWFEADLTGDVAEVAKLAGLGSNEIGGRLTGVVNGKQHEDVWDLGFRVQGRELARKSTRPEALPEEIGEVEVQARATLATKAKQLELVELAVVTPYVRADGAGTIRNLGETPDLDLKGNLSPDWQGLTKLMAGKVEPNASISGQPCPWRLVGTLPIAESKDGKLPDTLDGEVALQIDQADVFGMRLQQTRVVVRVEEGEILIDPIDSTLNGGRLHLDPELVVDQKGTRWLHLGRSSSLIDAEINDEVSHRVLSYVAPVLDQATRVEGRISLDLVFANIPLGGEDAEARVDGDVQFDNVRFMPGPLVDDLIGVFRLERKPLLVLRDPVSVRIQGRKIYQEGLILPVGDLAVIGVDGWVDFDKNLDLLASFALVPPKRNIPVLSQILESTQLQVPISGTLDKPKINGDAIKERFKNLGDSILQTALGIGGGGGGLGRLFQGGGGPPPKPEALPPLEGPPDELEETSGVKPAPAPVPADSDASAELGPLFPNLRLPFGSKTPEERAIEREARQERRLEKQNERRARRGLPPK